MESKYKNEPYALPSFLIFPPLSPFSLPFPISIVLRMPLIFSVNFLKFGGWECEYTPEDSVDSPIGWGTPKSSKLQKKPV